MRENAIVHVRFNLEKETHRQAYEALRQADRNVYPTYADAVAAALVRLFIEGGHEANVSALINACADRIAEAVAERLLEALPAGMVAARAVADSEPQNGAQNETQHSSGRSTGDTSDYIPDEEIPWDFLSP